MDGTYLFFHQFFIRVQLCSFQAITNAPLHRMQFYPPQNLFQMMQRGINVLHKLLTVLTNAKQLVAGLNLTGVRKHFFFTPISNAYTITLLSQSWTYTNTKKYCHNRA